MSGKKKKLYSELDSVSAKLSGLVEEARYKGPDSKIKVTEGKTLTKSLTSLREEEISNERHFDRCMEQVKAERAEQVKNHLEETKNLRIKKEIQTQLLEASKIELDILKREMYKLRDAKIGLLKEIEGCNNITNNAETETSAKDMKEKNILDNPELETERQAVEEIEKNLSELKKKSVQLVSAARTEKDNLRRRIAELRDLTVKRANCKREIQEFEKKELEKKSAGMKEKREKRGNKVAVPVREIQQCELSQTEKDQLGSLDEEIALAELKHKAVMVEIDQRLGGSVTAGGIQRSERREKLSELRARLGHLMEEAGEDLTSE